MTMVLTESAENNSSSSSSSNKPVVAGHNYEGIDLGEDRLVLPKRITASPEGDGRVWFARGWLHTLNYDHEEAMACFNRSIQADKSCVMALWGIAYSLSSNYNFEPGFGSGYDVIQAAVAGVSSPDSSYSELEKDLIHALAARSSAESKAAVDPAKNFFGNPPELNAKFSDEMCKLHSKYDGDLDVAAVYAEALMVRKPWALWVKDKESGRITPADSNTLVAKDVLEKAMECPGGMEHPGILHLYCHLMELSHDPVKAMPAANALRTLFPLAGHLTHMASHIDIWAGHYEEALEANIAAIDADNAGINYTGVESNFYKGYRIHNYHMAAWAALFTGQKKIAMDMARATEDMLPPGDINSGVQFSLFGCIPVGLCFLEPYSMTKWHVMIRFGMWDEIIAEPQYEDPTLYATGVASGHYARGIAFASKGLVAEAELEQAKYAEDMKNPALEGRMLHNNFIMSDEAPCVLKIGEAMLAGEIEFRKANFETAFHHLREAVRLDAGLMYDEPWGWMVPTAHALGALLLEQGHVVEATDAFRSDLKMYKENMWGLLGLYQCLEEAGDPEATEVKKRFDEAAKNADTKPTATCFCAKRAGAVSPKAASEKKTCCGE